jgi:hypothetical protein
LSHLQCKRNQGLHSAFSFKRHANETIENAVFSLWHGDSLQERLKTGEASLLACTELALTLRPEAEFTVSGEENI